MTGSTPSPNGVTVNSISKSFPFLEEEMKHNDDGTVTMRSMYFWEKQIMMMNYEWFKKGFSLNPIVTITFEEQPT